MNDFHVPTPVEIERADHDQEDANELLADQLAESVHALLDDETITSLNFNPFDMIQSLLDRLPMNVVVPLALKLDLCPLHHCDIEICADDDRSECFGFQ